MPSLYDVYPGIIEDFPQGTTVPISFTLQDTNGLPIDVTGYIMYLYISQNRNGTPEILEVQFPATDPLNGIMAGEISDSATLALEPGKYYYSLKYIKPDGRAYTIDMGYFTVWQGINPRVDNG